jgi:ATP-dependent Clp protease ATP-binding subunit ClpC
MQQSFHVYVRQHANNWWTASVLTHPEYAVFGPSLHPLKEELKEVLAQELATQAIPTYEGTFFEDLLRRVVDVEIKAVQHDRLIRVPMRFSILTRPLPDVGEELFEVRIPRLHKVFRIVGEDNIKPWAEEVIRGKFHLAEVETLLDYQYERGESLERLDVVYHGKGKKKAKKDRAWGGDDDELDENTRSYDTELAQVGLELVREAKENRLGRAWFREDEVRQLVGILSSGQSRSVLLVGPSGVGKTALVHELAHMIAQGQVPALLREVPLWHVTGGRIIAGMKYLGQWQERCLEIVEEIRRERGILYVDSLLELMMAGSSRTGLNVAQFLLPYVQSGEITVIAESSPDGLLVAEQRGGAFVHALRRMPLPGFTPERAFQILEVAAARLEREHRVVFSQEALGRALDVLARFGDADALPGAGLTLIEQMARLPQAARIEAAARGGEAEAKKAVELDKQGRAKLRPSDAVAAFARASGFPKNLIDPDERLDVPGVRRFFEERVVGQPAATELLGNLITVIKASLNDPERPLGSFLFMGPTGVGKTESALTLAEYLFGDRNRLTRFDMSEYGYPGSASRLVGGSRGEGDLTKKIREQPFSVILFDEIEKADSEVFDILLQVLGEGRLTDGTGRTVRFKHAILIMTSNLGAGAQKQIGWRTTDASARERDLAHHYREAARAFFRPEFLNRVDYLVPFKDLDAGAVRQIARRMLDQALAREGFGRRGISARYGEEVLDLLMQHGMDARYGARPMKRAVEQRVLVPLSRRLVLRADVQEETFDLYVHEGRVEVASSRGVQGALIPEVSPLTLTHDHLWGAWLRDARVRLHAWEESAFARRLRLEEGGGDLLPRLLHAIEAVRAAEAKVGRTPSALSEAAREPLLREVQALAHDLRALELALCLAVLPTDDEVVLDVDVPSLHPAGLRAAALWAAQVARWAELRGWTVARESLEGDRTRLRVQGPRAGTWLREEVGVHRLQGDEGEAKIDLIVTRARSGLGRGLASGARVSMSRMSSSKVEAVKARGVVRELAREPETLWDPETQVEAGGGLETLCDNLDRFLLARLCRAVAKGAA